jgi:protein-S-isoprenylcysteine O-methyltransferase Ste14
MNAIFLIAFLLCLAGYVYHTGLHVFQHKGYKFAKSKATHAVLEIMLFVGYLAWGFMIFSDPIKISMSNYVALPLGLLVGLAGLVIVIVSAKAKKGFEEIEHLITHGIYSRIGNPMYVGMILMHVGLPLAARSLLTLISAVIWVPLILIWKYMEEKDLEKKFGKEYSEYKKRTLF